MMIDYNRHVLVAFLVACFIYSYFFEIIKTALRKVFKRFLHPFCNRANGMPIYSEIFRNIAGAGVQCKPCYRYFKVISVIRIMPCPRKSRYNNTMFFAFIRGAFDSINTRWLPKSNERHRLIFFESVYPGQRLAHFGQRFNSLFTGRTFTINISPLFASSKYKFSITILSILNSFFITEFVCILPLLACFNSMHTIISCFPLFTGVFRYVSPTDTPEEPCFFTPVLNLRHNLWCHRFL